MREFEPAEEHFLEAKLSPLWESTSTRWIYQLMVGALPGLVLLAFLLHAAQRLDPQRTQGMSAASIIPLLAVGHMGGVQSFQRVDPYSRAAPQIRSFRAYREVLDPAAVETQSAPLPDFSQPRVAWQKLGQSQRAALDAGLAHPGQWERIVLHGSATDRGEGRLLARYHERVQGIDTGLAHHFVIGSGESEQEGAIHVAQRWKAGLTAADVTDPELRAGSISICLIGDFHHSAPTPQQLAALDELLDYLRMKLGVLPITTHHALEGGSCLGPCFPSASIVSAANADSSR